MELSIIIPFSGSFLHLKETVFSIQQQNFKKWECIIINDDRNVSDEHIYAQFGKDKIYVANTKGGGGARARNEGIENSKAELVIFLDADDLLAPWAMESRVNFMDSNPGLDFALFPALEFNHKIGDIATLRSSVSSNNELENFLSFQTAFQTSCPIWRRKALQKVGGWNEQALSWQDGEFHIRALIKDLKYTWGSETPDVFLRLTGEDKITSKAYDPAYIKNRFEIYNNIATLLPANQRELFRSSVTGLSWNIIEKKLLRTDINEVISYAIRWDLIDPADQSVIKAYVKIWYLSKQMPGLRGLIYRLRPLFKKRRQFFRKEKLSQAKKMELLEKLKAYPSFYKKYVTGN